MSIVDVTKPDALVRADYHRDAAFYHLGGSAQDLPYALSNPPGLPSVWLVSANSHAGRPGNDLIQRTLNTDARLVQHMRINHCRAHVFVAQQFLHGANIVAVFEQMRRKRMAQ